MWMLFLGACDNRAPGQDPDELQPTEACPLGEAETLEEAEAATRTLLQCLGHDPDQATVECEDQTRWYYLDEMTTGDDTWTVGADTLSCHARQGALEREYTLRVHEHHIPAGPYWGSDDPGVPLDPILDDPDAQRCRQDIPTFLASTDLEEAVRSVRQSVLCGPHREGDFDLYCWGPIHHACEFPQNTLFLCRLDSHLYRSIGFAYKFVGPGPIRPQECQP